MPFPSQVSDVSTQKQLFCPQCGYLRLLDPTVWTNYTNAGPAGAGNYAWPGCPLCNISLVNTSGASGGIYGDGQ